MCHLSNMKFVLPTNEPQADAKPLLQQPGGSNALTQQLKGPILPMNPFGKRFPIVPNPMEGLKRAVSFNADYGGCGFWRMLWGEMMINMLAKAVINNSTAMMVDPNFYQNITAIRMQRQATPVQREFCKFLRNLSNGTNEFKLIYEIDDIVFREDIPDYNSCKTAFDDPIIAENCMEIMKMCDEITVTCDFMKQYYMDKTGHKNVKVLPNYAPRFWMDRFYSSQKVADRLDRNKKRPRIGYFGSGTHFDVRNNVGQKDDFAHVVESIIKTRKEYQWVFIGGIPQTLKPFVHSGEIEFQPWTNLADYPYMFDKADVSVTIAPLQENNFNRAKSNIKYLEAGCYGIPCICQDMITYSMAPLKFKTGPEMIDQLRKLFGDRQYYTKHSKTARQYAETMWLEDHLDEYMDVYHLK